MSVNQIPGHTSTGLSRAVSGIADLTLLTAAAAGGVRGVLLTAPGRLGLPPRITKHSCLSPRRAETTGNVACAPERKQPQVNKHGGLP